MGYPFTISEQFICKDPEYEITYEETPPGGRRRCVATLLVDEIVVGPMETWEASAEPMSVTDRDRVLDRIAREYLRRPWVRSILRVDGVVLRLPGPYDVVLGDRQVAVRTPGRSAVFSAIELKRRDDEPRALVMLDTCVAWAPGGEPMTPDDRTRLAGWLRQDPRVEVVDTAASADPWALASELHAWDTLLVGAVTSSQLIFEVAAGRAEPPARTVFWMLELPALRHLGGGNNRPPQFTYGPIDVAGTKLVREWLFADDLPLMPNTSGGTNARAESRDLLWSWTVARRSGVMPPAEIAGRVLGVVLERGNAEGGAALAAYADGRVRYVGSSAVAVCEPGLAPELEPKLAAVLAHGQGLVTGSPTGRDASSLAEGAVRLTALTCAGAHTSLAPAAEVVRDFTDVLAALLHLLGPRDR